MQICTKEDLSQQHLVSITSFLFLMFIIQPFILLILYSESNAATSSWLFWGICIKLLPSKLFVGKLWGMQDWSMNLWKLEFISLDEGCDSTQIIFPESPMCKIHWEVLITITGDNWRDKFGVTISLPLGRTIKLDCGMKIYL